MGFDKYANLKYIQGNKLLKSESNYVSAIGLDKAIRQKRIENQKKLT